MKRRHSPEVRAYAALGAAVQAVAMGLMLTLAPPAHAASAAAEEMAVLLGRWQSISMEFVQQTYNANRRLIERRKGRLLVKKPRRFRLEIDPPDEELAVSDGDSFWVYDPLLLQAQKEKLQDRWETAPLLLISDDPRLLEDNWQIDASGWGSRRQFRLRPRSQEVLLSSIVLSFHRGIPAQLRIEDNLDQLIQLDFSDAKPNVPVADERFTFVPPPGVDLLVDEPL